jgi:hypothetical protein
VKFTIESFKTHIYRPAEWMINNEKISHLIGDLTKQFLNERFCSYSDDDGETFKITVSSDVCEDDNGILTVKFCTSDKDTTFFKNLKEKYPSHFGDHIMDALYDKAVFEDNFDVLVNKMNLPYWTASMLLKKINALVFKVLTDMQEYEDKSPIVVDPEDTETK